MKPRYSLPTLFGATAYVAIVVAAVSMPGNQFINAIAFYCWIAVTIGIAVEASQAASPRSVFARGWLLTCFLYLILAVATKDYLWPGPQLPSRYLTVWLESRFVAAPSSSAYEALVEFRAQEYIWRHAMQNCALLFGLLGGYLALRRYQSLQRQVTA